jgi:putative ABC transport system permease protein
MTGTREMILLLISIATLVLMMSIFNYLNFSISKQLTTLKDSGIKIANGAGVGHIRSYYITEVSLTVIVALTLALLLTKITLPFSEVLLNEKLNFKWMFNVHLFIPFLFIIALVIISASLVSFSYTSRLAPQALFKNTHITLGGTPVKRLFTVGQLTVSIILVTCLFFINKQLSFVKGADIGFNREQLLRIDIPWVFKNYEILKAEYAKLPFVQDLCLTSHSPGAGWSKNGLKTKSGKRIEVNTINIDKDFLKTFGINVVEGREIEDADLNYSCLISKSTYSTLEWEDFTDKKFNGLKVVGVVNDININSLHTGIVPVAFQYTNDYYSAINLRLVPGNTGKQMEQLKKIWGKLLPYEPMTFEFYDEYFNSLYKKEDRQAKTLSVFSLIAFIITCLGLLGQIMQTTQRRIKEIGIRKINGATVTEIMTMLNWEYMIEVLIALALATPIVFYSIRLWLNNFAYKTDLSWFILVVSGLLALGVTLFTVSLQSWRAATKNPVEALRYE